LPAQLRDLLLERGERLLALGVFVVLLLGDHVRKNLALCRVEGL
jgi:hypothetical protein